MCDPDSVCSLLFFPCYYKSAAVHPVLELLKEMECKRQHYVLNKIKHQGYPVSFRGVFAFYCKGSATSTAGYAE